MFSCWRSSATAREVSAERSCALLDHSGVEGATKQSSTMNTVVLLCALDSLAVTIMLAKQPGPRLA